MRQVRRPWRAATLGATMLAAALVLAGCGGTGSGSDRAASRQAEGQSQTNDLAAPGAAEGRTTEKNTPADLRVNQRAIIYTGSIVVRVTDIDEAAASATSIVVTAGGFIGADKRESDASHSRASLELRVPADKFSSVINQVAGLGTQVRRDINTEDVTEEALDLDARIATQRARVESGRRLLAEAKTLNDLILLEGELAKREADLAALEARKNRLDELTALSTITVTLLGPDARASDNEEQLGFITGLRSSWKAFLVSTQFLLTVLGALLPWLIGLGLPILGVIWLARRFGSRNRRGPSMAPAAPPVRPFPTVGPMPGPVPSARAPHGSAPQPKAPRPVPSAPRPPAATAPPHAASAPPTTPAPPQAEPPTTPAPPAE